MKRWMRVTWSRIPHPRRGRKTAYGADAMKEFDAQARRIAEDLRRVERRIRERNSHDQEPR
jgi:hypothetical protein